MEIKRATELSICSCLRKTLPDLQFYPAKGGGDDITPIWKPNNPYQIGDVLRPSNLSFLHAVLVTVEGNSGPTEPPFNDVPGNEIIGPPNYLTTSEAAISVAEDSGYPIPPFAAVMCEPSERTMAQQDTGIMQGTLVWVTKLDQTNVTEHSQNFKRIYDALAVLGSFYDVLRRIMIHGVDISGSNDFVDSDRSAHGDVIEFVVGVTAKPIQA